MARNRARKLFFDFQFRQQHGLPLHSKMMGEVISEYVSMREVSHDQGRTSACMLRQIKRVARFWREFAGSWPVEGIYDKELRDYLDWRRGYYASKESLPKNARLVPTDKTLQWEMMLGKAILRWATQKGLRGQRPLPTFSFVPKIKRVRPAFEREEFQRVCRTMIDIINEPIPERWRRSRELLQFYVLFLANCGVRVGEANAIRVSDIEAFVDEKSRRNFRLLVKGKTGERDVILRAAAAPIIDALVAWRQNDGRDDLLFAMPDGRKIVTLIDQFDAVLRDANLLHNSRGERFTLYSLRHYYAVTALRNGIGVFELARNMGTSVQVIQSYYGKHATAPAFATRLGD